MQALQNSLRSRLLTLIMLPLIVVFLAIILWRFETAKVTAEEFFDRNLVMLTFAISRDVALSDGDTLSVTTSSLFREVSGGRVFYHVYGPDGRFVTGYSSPPVGKNMRPLPLNSPTLYNGIHLGEAVRVVLLAEESEMEGVSGTSVITVWQKLSLRENYSRSLALRAAGLVSLLVLTVAALIWFGIGHGLKPLHELESAIQKRSVDDLSPIVRKVPSETKGIVTRLNKLFKELTDSRLARERLISNAAHQLRNPVAGIHAMAQATLSAGSLTETRARAQELVAETRRTSRLTEQILSLEKLDGSTPVLATIDLNELITEVATRNASRILSNNIDFSVHTADHPVFARGDFFLLSEALQNLLDNALIHGGNHMHYIVVKAHYGAADRADITVENDGALLPLALADKIFERFVQGDESQGSGLGLAIVAQIARMNGGVVKLVHTQPACFCLSLQAV